MIRFESETSRVGPIGTIWEGRSPVDGDMRGQRAEVHDVTGKVVASGVVVATGGFQTGSGPQIKTGDRVGIVVHDGPAPVRQSDVWR